MDKQGKEKLFILMLAAAVILVAVVAAANHFSRKAQCSDGADNDGDGSVDLDDAGCEGSSDKDESNCGDGVCEKGENPNKCPADCSRSTTCRDSDGGQNTMVQGTVTGTLEDEPYSSSDFCIDSGNLMEFYCLGTDEVSIEVNCQDAAEEAFCAGKNVHLRTAASSCSEGKCLKTNKTVLKEECEFGCTDSACNPAP